MQGSESEFVILSLVRSGVTTGNEGSLAWVDEVHIMCVAMSRQKINLIVVGDAAFLKQSTFHWKEFIEFIHNKQPITDYDGLNFVIDSTRTTNPGEEAKRTK